MRALCLAALSVFGADSALGNTNCYTYESLAKGLYENEGKQVEWLFLADDGNVVQLWVNRDDGTATAVIVRPDRIGCIASRGRHARPGPRVVEGDPA